MSWDVMIFNTQGKTPASMEEFDDSSCKPLGIAADVRERVLNYLPGIDWSDPTWGILEGDGFSIEFNVGSGDPVENMMLHVRGGGDAIATIIKFVRPMGWSALDCSTSEFLDLDNPSQSGWEEFQAFRDRVMKKCRDEGVA